MGRRLVSLLAVGLLSCAGSEGADGRVLRGAEQPVPESTTLTDVQAEAVLYGLLTPGGDAGWAAVAAAIAQADDRRFVAPLVDLLRFREQAHVGDLLEQLTGEELGTDWPAWVEWLGPNPQGTPPGYAAWKGATLALATDDAAFRRFLNPETGATVRLDEVVWGGVGVDAIPALENPPTTADGSWLQADDLIAGVLLGGQARAYPLRIINWHEMVNDVVGGVPVSLAYCTLCGSAVLYGTAGPDGPRTFGSSGLLMRSNKLMFDRQSDTLWNQLTGEPVVGPGAGGEPLPMLPVVIETWAEWSRRHPDTDVLSEQTGHDRDYGPGRSYGDYFASATTMFPVWKRKSLLPAKERIFAMRDGPLSKAWPLSALPSGAVLNDALGPQPVVLLVGRDDPATDEPGGRSVRAYARGTQRFEATDRVGIVRVDGADWAVTEAALLGPRGESLERLPGHVAYWFGWFAFFPQTEVFGVPAAP